MKKNKERNLVWWILGGIIFIGMGSFVVYKLTWGKRPEKTSSSQKPAESNNKKPSQTGDSSTDSTTSKEELEKYLLEKRLELKKYFVFNLGQEVKLEKPRTNLIVNGSQVDMDNGRLITPSLSNHLTKLTGQPKEAICFLGKDTKSISDEWREDKLNQKIRNGEQCYIIFDKTKISSDVCNYFAKEVGAFGASFPTVCALAMEDKKNVFILESKEEVLEFLTINDLALRK